MPLRFDQSGDHGGDAAPANGMRDATVVQGGASGTDAGPGGTDAGPGEADASAGRAAEHHPPGRSRRREQQDRERDGAPGQDGLSGDGQPPAARRKLEHAGSIPSAETLGTRGAEAGAAQTG